MARSSPVAFASFAFGASKSPSLLSSSHISCVVPTTRPRNALCYAFSAFSGNIVPLNGKRHYGLGAVGGQSNIVRQRSVSSVESLAMKKESDSNGASALIRSFAAFLVVGLVVTSFLPLFGSLKASFTGSGDVLVDQKLHRVPFFAVTDSSGRPFLVEADDHLSRRGYFFEDPIDAETYLKRVKTDSIDAKVLPVGLDEALGYVTQRKMASKDIPERFALFPSEKELATAREVTGGQFEETFGRNAVPLFYVDQLAFSSPEVGGSGSVYPVFFEKAALDKTLIAIKEGNVGKSAAQLGNVQVIDLLQTVREIKGGGNPRLERVAFLPLENAVRALKASIAADEGASSQK
jgi:Tic22-like family